MPTKKKRQGPKKPQRQKIKAANQQKASAFDRVNSEVDGLMFDVATVADKLIDLLPKYRRLGEKSRRLIYEHMNFVLQGLEASIDKYYETLPEDEDCAECNGEESKATARALGLGIAFRLSEMIGKAVESAIKRDEFPDSLDVNPEPKGPIPGGEHDS